MKILWFKFKNGFQKIYCKSQIKLIANNFLIDTMIRIITPPTLSPDWSEKCGGLINFSDQPHYKNHTNHSIKNIKINPEISGYRTLKFQGAKSAFWSITLRQYLFHYHENNNISIRLLYFGYCNHSFIFVSKRSDDHNRFRIGADSLRDWEWHRQSCSGR